MALKRIATLVGLAGAGWVFWQRVLKQPAGIKDSVVIITGASAGIGAQTAHAFAAHGAKLVLFARRADKLAEIEAQLAQYNTEVLTVAGDVTSDEDTQRVADATLERFGRIDVLVNNAGLSMGGALHKLDPAYMRKLIEVNYYGCVRMAQVVLPAMLAQRSGHIVNVGSTSSLALTPGFNVYAGLKAGLNAFTDSLRHEVECNGINVSLVLPGWTRTEMTDRLVAEEQEMRKVFLINPFIGGFKDAGTIAQGIVNAVRYKRQRVIFGPPLLHIQYFLNAYFTPIAQYISYRVTFDYFIDRERLLQAMEDLGV